MLYCAVLYCVVGRGALNIVVVEGGTEEMWMWHVAQVDVTVGQL